MNNIARAKNLPKINWWPRGSGRWSGVWQSNEFKALTQIDSWLSLDIIPLLEKQNIGWFAPPSGSRFYFSAWLMNSIMERTYDNPLIGDLYVLHEALHAASLDRYFEKTTPFMALRVNEIDVSLETECFVYLREPSWMGKTFSPLWIGEQLSNLCSQELDNPIEREYKKVSDALSFLPSQEGVARRYGMTRADIWRARRSATHFPKTSSDFLVQKYEKLSIRWISQVLPRALDVQEARLLLQKDDIDAFMRVLEENMYHGLPFGDLKPR